jgi:glutathione S-transferase
MLGLPYRLEMAPADVRGTAQFRRLNPLGQIPVLQDGDLTLADSNAILVYLAKRYGLETGWLPEQPDVAARVQRWLSIAAGEVRYGPALARMITQWNFPAAITESKLTAEALLKFMDGHLSSRTFLAAAHATVADLACYSYASHAPEGGISLDNFGSVRAWLRRVEALPHFKPMPPLPVPPGT